MGMVQEPSSAFKFVTMVLYSFLGHSPKNNYKTIQFSDYKFELNKDNYNDFPMAWEDYDSSVVWKRLLIF